MSVHKWSGFCSDLRNVVRQLAARPAFTLCVLTLLAVGVGANAATFSLVRGLLLRPLPYPHSESIVTVGQTSVQGFGPPILSGNEFQSLRDNAQSFEQLGAFAPVAAVWNRADTAIRIFGAAVTPSVFPLLGTTPQLGRLLVQSDAEGGGQRVVVLSNSTWITRFGADPSIVGATLEIDNAVYSVVGVMRDDFGFPHREAEFWMPLIVAPYQVPAAGGMVVEMTVVGIGRLRSGVSREQARVEVRTILDRAGRERRLPTGLDFETQIVPLRDELSRPLRPVLGMLTAATGLVLLMACGDMAILLLVHAVARQRQLAIRRVLGATRGWIARALIIECVVLGLAGSVWAVALAGGFIQVIPIAVAGNAVGLSEIELDTSVLAFAVGLSILVSLLFGTVPALFWSPVDIAATNELRGIPDGNCFGHLWISRVQKSLVVAQVGLAVVLLTGAGLLLRSFVELVTVDRGFDPDNVVLARVETSRVNFALGNGRQFGPEEVAAMSAAAQSSMDGFLVGLEDIANLAGVEAVGLSSDMPLGPGGRIQEVSIAGRPRAVDFRERLEARVHKVSPGYADVLRLRIRSGRFFTRRDGANEPRVAVVSESFARRGFRGDVAVGNRIVVQSGFGIPAPENGQFDGGESWEVIGVVDDVVPFGQHSFGAAAAGDVYLSMLQPEMDHMVVFGDPVLWVRASHDALELVPYLNEMLARVFSGTALSVTPLDTIFMARAAQPRSYAVFAGILAGLAMLLAAFGLYGVLSYTVSQREREIGIRVALGATRRDVVMLIIGQGAVLVVGGVIIGVLGTVVMTPIVGSVLFGVRVGDPYTLSVVCAVVLCVSLLTIWLPARRASRVNPIEVLRDTQ